MDRVVQAYAANGWFMGSVLAVRDGQILLDKGYGDADMDWQIANSPQTKFRLGSVTKQFTAAAILLLEQQGKLKTDDPVKKYLPDAPAAWDQITIYHLLTHSSGIPDYTGFPDFPALEREPTTPAQLVARFRDKPLDFAPGQDYFYNNSGYALLGYLIEKVSGKSYQAFLQDAIFTPLGMTDSGYDSNSKVIERRAKGYSLGDAGPENAGYIDMTEPFAAGALYSTTHDLLLWEKGLFGGKLLSAVSLRKMTTPFKHDYGCGLYIAAQDGHRWIGHPGGIKGFNSDLRYYPDDKLVLVVLGNLNGDAPDIITDDLAQVAFGKEPLLPVVRHAVKIDPAILDRYVGYYRLAEPVVATVARRDDRLFTRVTGSDRWYELFPENDHDFFLKIMDVQNSFVTDASGKATALVLHQGGKDLEAKRIDKAAAEAIDEPSASLKP